MPGRHAKIALPHADIVAPDRAFPGRHQADRPAASDEDAIVVVAPLAELVPSPRSARSHISAPPNA